MPTFVLEEDFNRIVSELKELCKQTLQERDSALKALKQLGVIVHCKDCRHMTKQQCGYRFCEVWGGVNGYGDDGFCCYGERRNDG